MPAKHGLADSGYFSINSTSDNLWKNRRISTARLRPISRQESPLLPNTSRSENVLHSKRELDAIHRLYEKQQSTVDLISNYNRLKPSNTRISIDTIPVQKFTSNSKILSTETKKQTNSKRPDILPKNTRKILVHVEKGTNLAEYSDDWESDYSDDWEPDIDAIKKPTNNSLNLIPSDPTAFGESFCRKRQAAIDNMSYRKAIDSWTAKAFDEIVKLITNLSSGKSLIDRAWIIFYWVSQNIEYDVDEYFNSNTHKNNNRRQTSKDLFASRKGICDTFGTIFEMLCTAVQIECKKINGYAKGYSFQIGQKSFPETNHAWNVIRLDGHWYLIDTTWGEGYIDKKKSSRKELNTFYFLVRPEQMIYRHFPENSQWQLLKSPLSMDQFMQLPFVNSTFFQYNLNIVDPQRSNMGSFNSNLGLAEVLVRAPSDTFLIGDITKSESDKIKNACLVQYDTNRQLWQCLFAPQRTGFYILTIYAQQEKEIIKDKNNSNQYSYAIRFGLQVPTGFSKTRTFPLLYGLFTDHKCQIFEPLDGELKSGIKVTIHCCIPGASSVRLSLDGNRYSEDLIKADGIFNRQIKVPKQEIIIYAKFSDQQNTSNYEGIFRYVVR